MLKYGRQLLILILFLLQGIAPLAHAHVHHSSADQGLHIEGLLSPVFSGKGLSTPTVAPDSMTIGIRHSIQQKHSITPKHTHSTENSEFLSTQTPHVKTPVYIRFCVAFTPPLPPENASFLNTIAPRAPPFQI